MLPAPAAVDIVMTSPDAVVAGLPYLIGFTPRESAVLLWLGRGRLLLTQRLDLPPGAPSSEWTGAVWSHAGARQADALVAVLVTDDSPHADIPAVLVDEAAARGVDVRDVLVVSGGRWRSLLCRDEACCGERGRQVDSRVAALVAAEFTGAGVAPSPDRASLESELMPAGRRRRPAAMPASGPEREQWRDGAIDSFVAEVAGPAARPASSPEAFLDGLVAALRDVRVRDTVLWEVSALDREAQGRALQVLAAALRRSGPGAVAPIATCAAVTAWLLGDGARAGIALRHALADGPDYSLAVLVDGALRAGLPPSAWREAMRALSREECRHGADAGEGRAREGRAGEGRAGE